MTQHIYIYTTIPHLIYYYLVICTDNDDLQMKQYQMNYVSYYKLIQVNLKLIHQIHEKQ